MRWCAVTEEHDAISLGSDLVDHVLFVDEVAGHLDEVEHLVDVGGPVGQDLLGRLGLGEARDARGPVDLAVQARLGDHVRDLALGVVGGELEELGEARHGDLFVVFGDDADVVLDDARVEQRRPLVQPLGAVARQRGVAQNGGLVGRRLVDEFVAGEELERPLEDAALDLGQVVARPRRRRRDDADGRRRRRAPRDESTAATRRRGAQEAVRHVGGLGLGEVAQHEEERRAGERVGPARRVVAVARRVVDVPVVLGELEGRRGVVVGDGGVVVDHEVVEAGLEVLEVVLVERLALDFLGHDVRAHQVLFREEQAHLFEDEVDFLALR
mmetsp:Transcript_18838/g.75140  ORF Transcript_18838/g.75140 Transcript_18838/m.75140 type:complete len:327 (-) Transcript_18838:647-1627(-)